MTMDLRYKRIFLVSPPSSSYLGAARPPQNLGYLTETLQRLGVETGVLDMRLGYGSKRLFREIQSFRPDLLGFSLVSLEYKRHYALIQTVKGRFPDLPVVVGGPHVTVLKERVLADCPSIDYAVVFEGEATLAELCLGVPPSGIRGLILRVGDTILSGGERVYEADLDQIPFPTYQGFEMNRYIREIPLNSSRGCPYRCVFCPNKRITKRYRWRSAHHVVEEIAYWYRRGYRVFNFDDDNFTLHRDRVFDLCDLIEQRGIRRAEFRCSNGIRADRVDEEMLRRMKSVGFHYIAFGVDGGNDKMLTLNRKGETLEEIEHAIEAACRLGFDVKIFCIIGMPGETSEDTYEAFQFVQKYPIKRVILNNPIPYPGTELFEMVSRNGWFVIPPERYLNEVTENTNRPVFVTPEMDWATRVRHLKEARLIERRVTRRAVRDAGARWFPLNYVAAPLVATDLFQRRFFENNRFRQWIEVFRHRRVFSRGTS